MTLYFTPAPEVTCPQETIVVCDDAEPFLLTGGIPVGGFYNGPGVVDNFFYPEVAGLGNHTIQYTVVNQFGCTGSCSFFIDVFHPLLYMLVVTP